MCRCWCFLEIGGGGVVEEEVWDNVVDDRWFNVSVDCYDDDLLWK